MKSAIDGEIAIREGAWVKLICGASNEDLPSITDLCAVYAAAGVHCIDVAADAAVVLAARKGLDWVESRQSIRPWLMISLSDGQDIHFRKAWFDPKYCPANCPRPCEQICPAEAIQEKKGINQSRCYGCGRCLPICPFGLIREQSKHIDQKAIGPLISDLSPDAVEIHTAPGRGKAFEATVSELMKANIHLNRLAVSCGLHGHKDNIDELAQELWIRHNCIRKHSQKPLWQVDGRPMSGDIGQGTSAISLKLWERLHPLAPPGPMQLAGGTNSHTIKHAPIKNGPSGIAFGGFARKLIQPLLKEAEARQISLREWPEGWQAALFKAKHLINPWLSRKSSSKTC